MSTLLQAQAALQQEQRTYEFDPKAVEALILKDLGLTPGEAKVEFQVTSTWTGYGMNEHQVHKLTGVKVTSTRTVSVGPYRDGVYGDK